MDIKSKRRIRCVFAFILVIFLTGGIVYGVSLFQVSDSKLNYVSNLNAKFENSEYYEAIISEQLQRWIVNQNLCDDSDDTITTYGVGSTDILAKMILYYKPIGKKIEKQVITNGNEKKPISKQVKGKKTFRIMLNRNVKIKKDGSIDGNYDYSNSIREDDIKNPTDYYAVYSEGGFYISLPESFYINKAQQRRIERGIILVGLPQDKFESYEKTYYNYIANRKILAKKFSGLVMGEFLGILILILLFASEKTMPETVKRTRRIWFEPMFVAIVILFVLGFMGCIYAVNAVCAVDASESPLIYTVTGVSVFACVTVLAVCLQDLIWRIRKGNLFDSMIIVKGLKRIISSQKSRKYLEHQGRKFQEEQLTNRKHNFMILRRYVIGTILVGIILVISSLGSSNPGWTILGIVIVGMFILNYLNVQYEMEIKEAIDAGKLVEQIDEIAAGNFDYASDLSEKSVYAPASRQLSNIGSGMEEALGKQMKDERMKIDLITNVSHDLKTPLTSIVGYTDLLLKEESLSPQARDYVMILGNKTERLQQLILDLFELAKATSGDVKVEFTTMNMSSLVKQVMVEMASEIEKSSCPVVYEDESEHPFFLGDVNRMYRVIQNVFENALKYALTGTRIFVQIENVGDDIVLEIKNTASYEMNFTKEEIMERFSRGDKTRSSDGTGLGLSIADSFTRNCNGRLAVEIDGDQFKVIIKFSSLMEGLDVI